MALNNFFTINFPYGIVSNSKGEWTAFNREYKPLGYSNSSKNVTDDDFTFVKYKNINQTILKKLGSNNGAIEEENGKIVRVFFYNDATNPSNSISSKLYKEYFEKLEILSKLKV